jgi:hypothetical protein
MIDPIIQLNASISRMIDPIVQLNASFIRMNAPIIRMNTPRIRPFAPDTRTSEYPLQIPAIQYRTCHVGRFEDAFLESTSPGDHEALPTLAEMAMRFHCYWE